MIFSTSGTARCSTGPGAHGIKPWSDSLEALGTARANESVLVTAKVTETVVRVNFEDGDLVEAGDVLVDLSGRAEVAGLEEAAAAYREAQQQFQRQQQLAAQKLVVNQAYESMGLGAVQTLGPILDGLMRNTPDAERFIRKVEEEGMRPALEQRDGPFGDYSQAPPERRPDPGNVIEP